MVPVDEYYLSGIACQRRKNSAHLQTVNEAATVGLDSWEVEQPLCPSDPQEDFYQETLHPEYGSSKPVVCDLVHVWSQSISHCCVEDEGTRISHVYMSIPGFV